jgi:hypothetical protein
MEESTRRQIQARIDTIQEELKDEREFRRFAASEDWQYDKSYARTHGLVQERNELCEMLQE